MKLEDYIKLLGEAVAALIYENCKPYQDSRLEILARQLELEDIDSSTD